VIPGLPAGAQGADIVAAVNDRIRRINLALAGTATAPAVSTVIRSVEILPAGVSYGTHAARLSTPAASVADAAQWYETDRLSWFQFEAGAWHWTGGEYPCPQAALPRDLGANDAGFRAGVTDYGHVLVWSGSAWAFAPGESSGYIVIWGLTAPIGGVWHPCDGGLYSFLQPNGTVLTYTLVNLNGNVAAIMGGGFSVTLNPATAPTLASGAAVALANDGDAGASVSAGTGLTVALKPHGHAATVTDAAINAPSVAHGGLPAYFTMSFWARA
jgi:hypothetical protein